MKILTTIILLTMLAYNTYSQPANDEPCDAIELTVGASATTGNNYGATDSYYDGVNDPTCANYDYTESYFDVWYYVIVPDNGDVTVETSASSSSPRITDTGLSLYFGSCDDLCTPSDINGYNYLCDDDSGNDTYSSINMENYYKKAYPGDTIWIRVWDNGCDNQGYFNVAAIATSDADLAPASSGDCSNSATICDDEDITANSTGSGNFNELNCSNHGELRGDEHYSTWLFFHAEDAGTIEFTIHPNNEDGGANDDYDFAIWEGVANVPDGQPTRSTWAVAGDQSSYTGCSSRDIGYNSGIDDAKATDGDGLDTQEGQCGDGWLKSISASAGEEFTMLIDNYTGNTNSFTLTWKLTNGSSLDCSTLPVNYISMEYNCSDKELTWQTLSEINNDYFTIEIGNSFDVNGNLIIDEIFVVNGSGTTNSITDYTYSIDLTNIYVVLSQVDYNGTTIKLETKYYSCYDNNKPTIRLMPNPASANSIVNIDGEYNKAEVYDILGKKVNINISNNQIIGLSKGLYLVRFDDNKPIRLIIQ